MKKKKNTETKIVLTSLLIATIMAVMNSCDTKLNKESKIGEIFENNITTITENEQNNQK